MACLISVASAGEWSPPGVTGSGEYTKATNTDGIVNTRHNLTQSFITAGLGYAMNAYRNNYLQVCVYCHTPHGANRTVDAPLWNRTTNAASLYTTYTLQLRSGQSPSAPGPNSLTCLSCHDGTIAVDSVVNMPGAGLYSAAQETSVDTAFLDTWDNVNSSLQMGFGPNCGNSPCYHSSLGEEGNGSEQTGTCMECHNDNNGFGIPPFRAFIIGADLTNDHPVGVNYPDPANFDFNGGMVAAAGVRFFDLDGDGRPDPNEVRIYDTGSGPKVECASCHDPHGVPSGGAGSQFVPSFLRVASSESTICLTCHEK